MEVVASSWSLISIVRVIFYASFGAFPKSKVSFIVDSSKVIHFCKLLIVAVMTSVSLESDIAGS